MQKDSTSKNMFVFGLGLVAGWFVKHLFDSPEFARKKDELLATTDEIRAQLMDSDEAERIKEIFGKTSEELTDSYHEAKEKLISELGMLQVSLESIDKQRYVELVTDVINDVRTNRQLSTDQIEALAKALSSDFTKIKRKRSQLLAKK
jgi:hypothetical protein